MKNILKIILLLTCSFAISQNRYYFYLEYSDLSYSPSVAVKSDGTLQLTCSNVQMNNVFKNYIIYKFNRCCENALNVNLQKTYDIECNDIKLMTDLKTLFPSIIVMTEEFSNLENTPLYTPNDYGTQAPWALMEHRHLDVIRAKEAWDITKGSNDVKIGILDTGYYMSHEDLIDKNAVLLGSNFSSNHGTTVAGLAAGDTDNNKGLASIGFNSGLILSSTSSFSQLVDAGAKVINRSAGSPGTPNQTAQNQINDVVNRGTVVVIAAGNGYQSGGTTGMSTTQYTSENYSKRYYYPASYQNVISVSTVGNWNQIGSTGTPYDYWIDVHKLKTPTGAFFNGTNPPVPVNEAYVSHQHNDSVDIVVPAYRIPMLTMWSPTSYTDTGSNGMGGTSQSTPIVAGTIGLMFDVNYCLKPKEIESILKLTAVNIENMPENTDYYGRLGAGRLDAYEAVKMAKDMKDEFGTVTVKDRILYRWFYKLETAPYEIKLINNNVTQKAKLKFKARNDIDILSGDYYPNSEGYVDLNIDTTLSSICSGMPVGSSSRIKNENIDKKINLKVFPNPNNGIFNIKFDGIDNGFLEIYDLFGQNVYKINIRNEDEINVKMNEKPNGVYILKIISDNEVYTSKFFKN